jgi:predicted secreted Zn-dependent protease
MPILRVPGGYQVENTPTVHRTKREAMRQLLAIKASQAAKKKKTNKPSTY